MKYSAFLLALSAFVLPVIAGDMTASDDLSDEANRLIQKHVVDRLMSTRWARLSRARPRIPERKIEFNVAETIVDADEESYFAFTVMSKHRGEEDWVETISGCFYPETSTIYVESEESFVLPDDHPALVGKKRRARAETTSVKAAPCSPKSDITG